MGKIKPALSEVEWVKIGNNESKLVEMQADFVIIYQPKAWSVSFRLVAGI
jgi:hypothetical protein